MPATTAETIIFAINAAIRLGRNTQRAYAKSLRARTIVLPLPDFKHEASPTRAKKFFLNEDEREGGAQFLAQIKRLEELHVRFGDLATEKPLSDSEIKEYIDYYKKLSASLDEPLEGDMDKHQIDTDALVAMLHIRQYELGKTEGTSPLQMVAGTLVELGIDYFNQIPGALNQQSAPGQVMGHFLRALDTIPLGAEEGLRQHWKHIVPQLFVTAAEVVNTLSTEVSIDPKVQVFIQATTQGIANDLNQRLQNADVLREEETVQWGRLVMRSMVSNAGAYVFEAPNRLFTDLNEAENKLIQETGLTLLDFILKDPDKLDLKSGFTTQALDGVVQAAFRVVAQHPDLVTDRQGIREVVAGVSRALAQSSFKRADYFPELLRLTLEQTATYMNLFWREGDEAGENIFVVTLQEVLTVLSRPTQAGQWHPRLTRDDLLQVAQVSLDAVVQNPQWMLAQLEGKPLLPDVLRVTLDALAVIPASERLRGNHWLDILQLNLATVARNQAVLQPIRWSNDEAERVLLERGLEMVFTYIFRKDAIPPAERALLLPELLNYSLNVVLSRHADARGLALLELVTDEHLRLARAGTDWKTSEALLDAGLAVLTARPDLLTSQTSLQLVVKDVAAALQQTDLPQTELLPEFVRLVFESTARNAHTVLGVEEGQPKFLVVVALRELLTALSAPAEEGRWRPRLAPTDWLQLSHTLLDSAVQHPEWVTTKEEEPSVWITVTREVVSALHALPPAERFSMRALEYTLLISLRSAALHPALLKPAASGEEGLGHTLLNHTLTFLIGQVYDPEARTTANPTERWMGLMNLLFDDVLQRYPDRRGLVLLNTIVFDSGLNVAQLLDRGELQPLLQAGLAALEQHPDLAAHDRAIQHLLRDAAGCLRQANLPLPLLLPELFRLSLHHTALHLNRRAASENGDTGQIVMRSMEQILNGLCLFLNLGQEPNRLRPGHFLNLVEQLMTQTAGDPQWLTNNLLGRTLEADFRALSALPPGQALPPDTLEVLIVQSIAAVHRRRQLVDQPATTDEEWAEVPLVYALRGFFKQVYGEGEATPAAFAMTSAEYLNPLLTALLDRLAASPADQPTIDEAIEVVETGMNRINNNEPFRLSLLLSQMSTG